MKLQEAIEDLINSEAFKEIARQKDAVGSYYRLFLSRYKKGTIKSSTAIDLLLKHGYIIDVKKVQ